MGLSNILFGLLIHQPYVHLTSIVPPVVICCVVWVVQGVGVGRVGRVDTGCIEKSGVGLRFSFCFPLAQVMVRCSVWPGRIGVWPGVGFVAGVGGVWHGVSHMAYGGVDKSGVGLRLSLR